MKSFILVLLFVLFILLASADSVDMNLFIISKVLALAVGSLIFACIKVWKLDDPLS